MERMDLRDPWGGGVLEPGAGKVIKKTCGKHKGVGEEEKEKRREEEGRRTGQRAGEGGDGARDEGRRG